MSRVPTTAGSSSSSSLVLCLLTICVAGCGTESPAANSAQPVPADQAQPVAAQAVQEFSAERHTGFSLIDDYILEVAGERSADALLYSSSETRALLVVSEELPAPVLLWPRSRRVETLQMLKVAQKPGGTAEVLPNPVIAVHPPFRVETPDVKFSVDGIEAALTPKPPLIGLQGAEDMVAHSLAYGQRADAYIPVADALESLRRSDREVTVKVFFGSWCPACGQMVPRIIKVAQELGADSSLRVEYYGLPRGFAGDQEAEKYGITAVPSAVVFSDGREIGRINGNEWRNPELTLRQLLGLS